MPGPKIWILDRVEDLLDKSGKVIGRTVYNKAGDRINVKTGQGKSIAPERWEELQAGKAYKFTMAEYEGHPYPTDFEAVINILEQEALQGVQDKEQMTKDDWAEKNKITRKSIERQKALEEAVKLAIASNSKMTNNMIIATAMFFEEYLETGQIPIDKPEAKRADLKQTIIQEALDEKKTQAVTPPQVASSIPKTEISPIDLDWLEKQLDFLKSKGVKGWEKANIIAYLNTIAGKHAETLKEAVANLSDSEAKEFVKKVKNAVAKAP